jgi:hypothetical protein
VDCIHVVQCPVACWCGESDKLSGFINGEEFLVN